MFREVDSVQRRGSLSRGLCLGGLCLRGLCPGGLFSGRGSLSRISLSGAVSVRGVSVQGVFLCLVGFSVQEGSLSRGFCLGVSVQGGLSQGDPP